MRAKAEQKKSPNRLSLRPLVAVCVYLRRKVWDRLNPAPGTLVRLQEGFNESRPTREVMTF